MGGGEYERRASFAIDRDADVEIAQGDSIQTAFNSVAGGGVVEIQDSGRYEETPTLAPDPAARVELRAANEHRPAWVLSGDLNIDVERRCGADLERSAAHRRHPARGTRKRIPDHDYCGCVIAPWCRVSD